MLYAQLIADMLKKSKPVKLSKARSTGTHILLIDNRDGSLEEGGGAWQLLCMEHGGLVGWDLNANARSFMAEPETWCPVCQGGE